MRVIDGDTVVADVDLGFDVWLTGQKLRLYGINTPESRTRVKEEKKRGLAAKARLVELLSGCELKRGDGAGGLGIEFYLVSHEKGKYGRILAELFSDAEFGVSINRTLVDEGHAVEYFGGRR